MGKFCNRIKKLKQNKNVVPKIVVDSGSRNEVKPSETRSPKVEVVTDPSPTRDVFLVFILG